MKKRFYIKMALVSFSAMALLSSCLKDSRYVDYSKAGTLIEFPLAEVGDQAGIGGPFQKAAFAISATPQVLKIAVNVAAAKPLTTALTVKVSVDQAALDAYNAADSTSYTLLPAADYSSTLTVTIPANQNIGYLTINLNTNLIDASGSFVLPLTITDASGQTIAPTDKTLLYNIAVKNVYDGEYAVTGTLVDNTDATIVGSYPNNVDLVTQSANSDAYFDVAGGGFQHAINTSAGASSYGSFAPVFTFDANNNVTSVTNYYGQFSGSHARSAVLDPTGVNKFTSGTPGQAGSVFQVSYYMDQGNPGAPRTHFQETFTYKGSR